MASAVERTDWFVIPTECRFVWQALDFKKSRDFQNNEIPLDKRWYEITILIPKAAGDCMQPPFVGPQLLVQKAWEVASKLFKGNWRQGARWPIEDGDTSSKAEKYPFMRGHWVIGPWSNFAPPVIVSDPSSPTGWSQLTQQNGGKNIEGQFTKFKDGDYGTASINAFAYETGAGGVNFGIEGVKKTRDGEPLGTGGGRSAEQMFGVRLADAAPMPPVPPQYQQPPAPQPQYQQPPAPQPQYQQPPAPQPQYQQPPAPQPQYQQPPAPQPYPTPGAPGYAPTPAYPASTAASPPSAGTPYPSSGAPVYGAAPPVPFGTR